MKLATKVESFIKEHSINETYANKVNHCYYKYWDSVGTTQIRFVDSTPYTLIDENGKEYLDLVAGFACLNWGRKNPELITALEDAINTPIPSLTQINVPTLAAILGHELLELTDPSFERVFFLNSGTEAVEYAMKMAIDFTRKKRFVSFTGGYHGLTLASLSINGVSNYRKIFGVEKAHFQLELNNIDALNQVFKNHHREIAGVIVEPIQGRTGSIASDEFLREAKRLCQKHNALLIYDEVQTGLGRTGKRFAYEWSQVTPDIMTLAKGLSGGMVPIGAVVYTAEVYKKVFDSMEKILVYSSTFKENNLSMAAGLASLENLRNYDLANIQAAEAKFRERLELQNTHRNYTLEVAGKGLMLSVSIQQQKKKIAQKLFDWMEGDFFYGIACGKMFREKQVLCTVGNRFGKSIAIRPALTIPPDLIDQFCDSLFEIFDEMAGYSNVKFLKTTYEDIRKVV
ncbi:aspartate aminotransferase family protein [Leptolyngbyaceae cyanobacterium CCMR0082]|uniref:Aspartate aminotransferase family protein n=2 Tax=Adonisia turfae TaxID=2950184 RepID=A0A6M0RZA4_9CYAN|nr:aspartate aminotransferase family protein [Adonisia turfae]MDV3349200.1 aspartate aminotransferase family protein [Leptothoe sp. LEGE 181152]NEZ55580.1 aspartate aminotransferase family protein [Adonisia turfae CCMR0081]NEZ61534.1 aspartate aminotransferase family protein [Adonisia turfae CCMR0082]